MSADLDLFLANLRQAGIQQVIIAMQDEWDLTDQRGFGPVLRARLLAYQRGTLTTHDVAGHTADALATRVRAAGLTPSFRSRNHT